MNYLHTSIVSARVHVPAADWATEDKGRIQAFRHLQEANINGFRVILVANETREVEYKDGNRVYTIRFAVTGHGDPADLMNDFELEDRAWVEIFMVSHTTAPQHMLKRKPAPPLKYIKPIAESIPTGLSAAG